ncbi:DUF5710 domain-containing protein [uncultured Tyzzerella sp.]|uniref:DUF5710 domain-containing protein n=1 Tax=uncultured Tyzzerella sp. TaxID=2321398 RepID=UPI0029433472|nr:DUF5710 domain-containing protein [uncultured Tyzzerella sp.]
MLILNVPYNEKDEAKSLGARWNAKIKKWYVQDNKDYYKFVKWIKPYGDIVIIDHLYVVEGIQKCFKCGKDTRVIGFGVDKHLYIDTLLDNVSDDKQLEIQFSNMLEQINEEDIHIVGAINPIPELLMEYLKNKYNYKLRYSKTTNRSSISNCCDNCDVLQGDFFLFYEVDSPFFIYSEEDVKKLKIYKINLDNDIIVNCYSYGRATFDNMFKKYGNIVLLDIKI